MNQDNSRALFLDRDGVINEERPDDYIKSWDEFVFIPGVLEAIARLSRTFSYVFIVTNQRGVGRGLMSVEDLNDIHRRMIQEISAHQGRIDHIYTCLDTNTESLNRKPNIGMAWQAVRDFPSISLQNSIMTGNSMSDMKFGRNAGMTTVLVGNKYTEAERDSAWIDYYFDNLLSFSTAVNKIKFRTQ